MPACGSAGKKVRGREITPNPACDASLYARQWIHLEAYKRCVQEATAGENETQEK